MSETYGVITIQGLDGQGKKVNYYIYLIEAEVSIAVNHKGREIVNQKLNWSSRPLAEQREEQFLAQPLREFGTLGNRALGHLEMRGITTVQQLLEKSEAEISNIHGLGRKTMRKITKFLTDHDRSFRQPDTEKPTS